MKKIPKGNIYGLTSTKWMWIEDTYFKVILDKLRIHKNWIIFLILFSIFSVAYSALSPSVFMQTWESLMYAYWAEVKGLRSIWGNHALGHFILNSSYVFVKYLGYQDKALPVQIIANSIFGGLTVALFFTTLHKLLRINFLYSLGLAIIFGVSYGFWNLSGSAEIYTFSILISLLSWASLIFELLHRNRRFLYVSGSFAGLNFLTHQLSGVFFIVGLLMILAQKKEYVTRLISFFATAFIIAGTGYLLLGQLATSSLNISEIYQWTRGYVGDPVFGDQLTFENIPIALQKAAATIMVPTSGRSRFVRLAIISIFLGIILFGFSQIKSLDGNKQIVFISAFVQCFISWFLIMWFLPSRFEFWILTFVPWMILFSIGAEAVQKKISFRLKEVTQLQIILSTLPILMGLGILAFNLKYAVISEHKINPASQQNFDIWLNHSEPHDILITAGDLIPQLWFWGNRPNTVHLYHYLEVNKYSDDRFEYLHGKINQTLCKGNKVIISPEIVDNFLEQFLSWLDLSRDELRIFVFSLPKEEYFTYNNLITGEEIQVYSLLSSNHCMMDSKN